MPGFVLLVRPRGDGDAAMRIGLTVSKKVGGAVVRNRMKRRLRELVRAVLPEHGVAGADHVLIGRAQGVERDFALLKGELIKALGKLKSKLLPFEGRGTAREASGGEVSASQNNRDRGHPSVGLRPPPPLSGED